VNTDMKVAGLKHREYVSRVHVTYLRLNHKTKLSSSNQLTYTQILLADLGPVPQDNLSPVSPSLRVFLEEETSESVVRALLSFHLSLRDVRRGHAQPVHPLREVSLLPLASGDLCFSDTVR